MSDDFAVLILSHGRADKVSTLATLKRCGYTGRWYIVIDDEDSQGWKYKEKYGDHVVVFNKAEQAEKTEAYENFGTRKAIIYARNACFDIAAKLGLKYFMELDDDYTIFSFEYNESRDLIVNVRISNIDRVIQAYLQYFTEIPALSIAFAQGGDFMGGKDKNAASHPQWRKCMNSFICSVDRPFQFRGTINEDVNTYTMLGSQGNLFLTVPLIGLRQKQSQQNSGGMSEAYLISGTYLKSFYTVLAMPSSVIISLLMSRHPRLHHMVKWECTVPKIVQEKWRKQK